MGDDLPDLPMLRRVGYPMAVANAAPELLELAVWTSRARGGDGAVREAVEHLMRAAGVWGSVVERHA
jgi:3-deoxy-D-manno-octulosonate 8-phosphate phosphatase KdsC-like HAD superfamily phosphatase